MAYSELIKNFAGVRDYMRQFLVYGFRSREEFDAKSARSYDNERRRVESWLADYMAFRYDEGGKAVFLSLDSRHIPHNPLYKAWKASSFTKNDISLHFIIMDILSDKEALTVAEILACLDRDYLPHFPAAAPSDESTLRKKLREYVELGLIAAQKQGKQLVYSLPEEEVEFGAWQEAVSFFAEENPLGVVGSFILDKYDSRIYYFSFKHRYLLFALDSGIMLDLLTAIRERREVGLALLRGKDGKATVIPLKIYVSVQGGRQYLAACRLSDGEKRIMFYRLDHIEKVELRETSGDYAACQAYLKDGQAHYWGVSAGRGQIEHLEMTLTIRPEDLHIARRLEREKRGGTVTQLNETTWRFAADVYDAWEMAPWLRTFIGRIVSLTCSNQQVEEQFWADFSALAALYGGEENVV